MSCDRLSTGFDNLELVTRLDAIRIERTLIKPQANRGPEQLLSVTAAPGSATPAATRSAG